MKPTDKSIQEAKEISNEAYKLVNDLVYHFDIEATRYENGKLKKKVFKNWHWRGKDHPEIGLGLKDALEVWITSAIEKAREEQIEKDAKLVMKIMQNGNYVAQVIRDQSRRNQ